MRDKIKGRRLNWAEMRATRFSRSLRRRHCEIGVFRWLAHKTAFLLDSPNISVTRPIPANTPIYNTITIGDKTQLFNSINDSEIRLYRGTITLQRAIALREIYDGSDESFASSVADLLTYYIQLDTLALANGIATTHPELHEFVRDTFKIQTCLSTPLNFPLSMDITPKNISAPSHLYPLPPQFTNITGSPNNGKWLSHKNQYRNKTYCIHHQADIHIINHCKLELLSLAKNEHRGVILIETQNINLITSIPRHYRDYIDINVICSIPPLSIYWTNHKGESINPNDNPRNKFHGWSTKWNQETNIDEITSPQHDGRWDLPRSSLTPLNKFTVYMVIFHHRNDQFSFTHTNTRHLSDILSRISAPIPPGIQFENYIPILHLHNQKQSLALRHQPHIPSDPIDIFQSLRDCQFFPGEIPEHLTYSPSFKTFQPLLILREGPLLPDGHIPMQLINYCATKDNTNPENDAASIIAVIMNCTMKIENERRYQILNLMYLIGSPVLHLEPSSDSCIPLLSCQNCDRQVTTLWEIPKDTDLPNTIALRENIIKKLITNDLYFTTSLDNEPTRIKIKTQYQSKHLYTCYLCAIPTISEFRESQKNEKRDQVLNDLRAIARNEAPCLRYIHMLDNIHPWGSTYDSTLINIEFTSPKDNTQTGIVFCLAPKYKPKEETKYIIRFSNLDQPPSFTFSTWDKTNVIDGIKHHRSLHGIHTHDLDNILFVIPPVPAKGSKAIKRHRSMNTYLPSLEDTSIQTSQIPARASPSK